MGHDWRIAAQVIATVLIQITMAILVQEMSWKYIFILTYVISGTLNQSLSISFHESTKKIIRKKEKTTNRFTFFCIL